MSRFSDIAAQYPAGGADRCRGWEVYSPDPLQAASAYRRRRARLTAVGEITRMVELTASGDADQVEARLSEALDAHGLQLFARSDHATGARKAGVELEANVLLIFGNPHVGTPLMQADPRVGIELPLRMLIWQDPDGTHVGYLDPRELADRYALDGHQQTLEQQTGVLSKLAAAAAG